MNSAAFDTHKCNVIFAQNFQILYSIARSGASTKGVYFELYFFESNFMLKMQKKSVQMPKILLD